VSWEFVWQLMLLSLWAALMVVLVGNSLRNPSKDKEKL